MRLLVSTVEVLTRFKLVNRAAVRALGLTRAANIQVHLGMAIPYFHICQRAGAKHTTLVVEVFGQEFSACHTYLYQLKTEQGETPLCLAGS